MAYDSTRKTARLVLLDRDGVINHDSPDYIKSAAEWHPLPGALDAIRRLNEAGIHTALCSNQAGIGRRLLSARDLSAIHVRMRTELAAINAHIDLWRYCPHHPDDTCSCRKPNSAMLDDCIREFCMPSAHTVFIGDSIKDMRAAINANCTPLLVRTGNGSDSEVPARELGVTEVHDDLAAAVTHLLAANSQSASQE